MRALTLDETSIVSGGDDSPLDEVIVPGKRIRLRSVTDSKADILLRSNFQMEGGEGSANQAEEDTPRDTPCVTDKPTKHGNILDIHQGAIDLKEKMPYHHSLTPGVTYEYFGLIWKLPGGAVQTTEPVTSERPDAVLARDVWEALDSIPDGAIILGVFHSQPDNGRMSDYDWSAHKVIFNNPDSPSMVPRPENIYAITESIGRGITADPNGLSYVYDMKTGKIHVYDRSDMNSDKEQCHVNNVRGSR